MFTDCRLKSMRFTEKGRKACKEVMRIALGRRSAKALPV